MSNSRANRSSANAAGVFEPNGDLRHSVAHSAVSPIASGDGANGYRLANSLQDGATDSFAKGLVKKKTRPSVSKIKNCVLFSGQGGSGGHHL
jgi:hypothetical protein